MMRGRGLLPIATALALLWSATTAPAAEEAGWAAIKLGVDTELQPQPATKGGGGGSGEGAGIVDETTVVSDRAQPGKDMQLKVRRMVRDKSPRNDLKVVLTLTKYAVAKPVDITMTVQGSRLDDLRITFKPAGLEFIDPAKLRIVLGADRYDEIPTQVTLYHEYADGTIETVVIDDIHVIRDGTTIIIRARIPGFSRYSLGL